MNVTEALIAITKWAFTEFPVVRLDAPVYGRNPASTRVLEKAGYAFEGRLRARYFRDGQYIDALLCAKIRLPL
jgi:RimJ/RimL family protein N-acetyltransferase